MAEIPTIIQFKAHPTDTRSRKVQLEVGKHYLIRYRKFGGRIILEAVLRYIGTGDHGQPLFSGRPRALTQEFGRDQIRYITKVPDDSEIYINWDPRSNKPPESWPYAR